MVDTNPVLSTDDFAEISVLLSQAMRPAIRAYLKRALPKIIPPIPDHNVGDVLYARGDLKTTAVVVLEINEYGTLFVKAGYPYGTYLNIVECDRHLWVKVIGHDNIT